MGAFVGIMTQVWTALTGQVTTYLSANERFPREFLFPSLAFLLGLLAIVIGIVGVDAPRVWWEGLSLQVTLVMAGLAVALLLIVAELNRSFVQVIRRLYTGQLPSAFWQRYGLRYYLDKYGINRQNRLVLDRAQTELRQARQQLSRVEWERCAVLARPVSRFEIIEPDNWKTILTEPDAGSVESASKFIGRYAVQSLPAGRPVPAKSLRSLPDLRYLDNDRALVEVTPRGTTVSPSAGSVVTMLFSAWDSNRSPIKIDDVFVVDRSDKNQLVLAIPETEWSTAAAVMAHREVAISYPLATHPALAVLPVAARTIPPNTVLQPGDIGWVYASPLPNSDVVRTELELLDHLYQPPIPVGSGKPAPALSKGQFFIKAAIIPPPPTPHLAYQLEVELEDVKTGVAEMNQFDIWKKLLDAQALQESLAERARRTNQLAQRLAQVMSQAKSLPKNDRDRLYPRAIEQIEIMSPLTRQILGEIEKRTVAPQYFLPADPVEAEPTELGNILTAALNYPRRAFAIDPPTILPRLLVVLKQDDELAQRLKRADSDLNILLLYSFWAAVLTIIGFFSLLALRGTWWVFVAVMLIGPLVWWSARQAAITQALAYGQVLKAVFDLRRRDLLTAFGFELPTQGLTPQQEQIYWGHLYNLFALGHSSPDFPPLKPLKKD